MSDVLAFHPQLVEEAVWEAVRGRPAETAYHAERAPIYLVADPEERDRAFALLHARWFARLGLGEAVRRACREQEDALAGLKRCLVGPARRRSDEGAELYVASPADRSVVISLRPGTLAEPEAALPFLRRELLHVADMLDPGFRYEPRLPRRTIGPAEDRLLQDRYRLLWDCTVDGRLAAAGLLDPLTRERRLAAFMGSFACLGDAAGACFARLFDGPRPTHPRMVTMAADPAAGFGVAGVPGAGRGRCPLCGFQAVRLIRDPGEFPEGVLPAIRADAPGWVPEHGACGQCADLYAARMPAAAPGLTPPPGSLPDAGGRGSGTLPPP